MGAQAVANPARPRGSAAIKSSPFVPYSYSSVRFAGVAVLILLVAVVPSSPSSSAYAQGGEVNQAEILRKFKSALANADPALADWNNSPNPPCAGDVGQWTGVVCFDGFVWGLQLENMNLAGRIDVDSLAALQFFRTLNLMNNNFEGPMPDWRKLGALKSLYLSNNRFSGEIAGDAFRGMASLKKIYLENNRFIGPIPSSLESQKLIELKLENNQFTGLIPPVASDILKVFNVSNNQLQGPIPENLQKWDPSSFAGNQGLCGKPLETPCSGVLPNGLDPSLPANGQKSSPAKIAIIAVCVLLGLLLIIVLVFILQRRRREPTSSRLGKEVPPPKHKIPAAPAPVHVAVAAARAGESLPSVGNKGGQQQGSNPAGKLSFVREDRWKFDLQDLMRASAEVLGSGTFGAAYKAVLVDGEALVVKRCKQMKDVGREDFHEHMRRLGRLRHPNLLPLVAYLYRKEEKLLVFDYVSNGSLAKHLHGKRTDDAGLSWAIRLKIVKGVAKGMIYLHNELPSVNLPHGHLKSSNVLLDTDFNPLLMDYTHGPVANPNQVHQILVAYMSPEYAKSHCVSKKADVWCLGLLILEILTGRFVITQGVGHRAADLAGWIIAIVNQVSEDSGAAFDKEMGMSSERCWPEMEKLLRIGIACCEEDVDKRPDMEEAVWQIEQVQESAAP